MTKDEWARIVYFAPAEFDSKDAAGQRIPGSGYDVMKYKLVSKLDALRADIGEPIVVESGYRTPERNAQVGGVKASEHMSGEGADIRTKSMAMGDLKAAIKLAIVAAHHGFDRIGVDLSGKFIHVGVSATLPTPATWFYHDGVPAPVA